MVIIDDPQAPIVSHHNHFPTGNRAAKQSLVTARRDQHRTSPLGPALSTRHPPARSALATRRPTGPGARGVPTRASPAVALRPPALPPL
eukprot:1810316-Prymnesium_polylepis.1